MVLSCDASGVPPPHFRWFFNELTITPTVKHVFANNDRELTINHVSYYDIGEYVCTMSNAVNQLNSSATLSVNGQCSKCPIFSTKQSFLTLCETTARSTKLTNKPSFKNVFYQRKEALLLTTTLPCLKVFVSLIKKNKSKGAWHTENLAKVVPKRSHQEECVQSAKTTRCVASFVALQVLQGTDKLPSFPSQAEFSQVER